MGPTAESPAGNNDAVEAQLDALMPKPASRLTRWLVGVTLFVATIGFSYLIAEGMIVPRPTSNGSWGGSQAVTVADDGSTATAEISIPNWSGRDVRVTDIILPHEDVVLVDVVARFDPPDEYSEGDCEHDTASGITVCSVETERTDPTFDEPMFALPLDLPSGGGRLILEVTFAPSDCSDPEALATVPALAGDEGLPTWDNVEARFDFGDGAFPPFSSTALLDETLNISSEAHLLQTMCELQAG